MVVWILFNLGWETWQSKEFASNILIKYSKGFAVLLTFIGRYSYWQHLVHLYDKNSKNGSHYLSVYFESALLVNTSKTIRRNCLLFLSINFGKPIYRPEFGTENIVITFHEKSYTPKVLHSHRDQPFDMTCFAHAGNPIWDRDY